MRKIAVNDVGLTLVEVMIAMAVVAVVLLAATQGTIWMAKNNQMLATKTSQATASATGSRGFTSTFETASIAVGYEHLPVQNGTIVGSGGTGNCTWDSQTPTSFNGAGPCTAQLVGGNLYATSSTNANNTAPQLNAGTLLGTVNYVEFFRDDDATIHGASTDPNLVHPFAFPGNGAVVQKTFPLSNTQLAPVLANANPFYAAWPLVPEVPLPAAPGLVATFPLLVLQASSATDPLIFSNITFDPFALPTATVGRNALMQVTNFNDAPQAGTIYLIYNTYDPTQYIFQYAQTVVDCTKGAGPTTCQDIVDNSNNLDTSWSLTANLTGGSPTGSPGLPNYPGTAAPLATSPAAWFASPKNPPAAPIYPGDTIHYFAINLQPVPSATLTNFYPTAASLFGANPAYLWYSSSGTASGQNLGLFPFPFLTQFSSFFVTPAIGPTYAPAFSEYQANGSVGAGSGEDIRKMGHYYQTILGSGSGSSIGNVTVPPFSGGSIGTMAQLVAVPVTLKSFNLYGPIQSTCTTTGKTGTKPCSTFNLVVDTVSQIGANPPSSEITLMDHLPIDGTTSPPTPMGSVIIARQIGGANFQMFYFSPGNISVSAF